MRDDEIATMPTGTTAASKGIDLTPLFNVPGVVWISLIAAMTKWVSDSFPDQPWAPAVVIVLGMAAKLIQVYWPKPAPAPGLTPAAAPGPADGDDYTYATGRQAESAGHKFARFLIG